MTSLNVFNMLSKFQDNRNTTTIVIFINWKNQPKLGFFARNVLFFKLTDHKSLK